MGFPKYLYKFRSLNTKQPKIWDESLRMLTAKEIFFASPNAFNDPLDSGSRIRYEKCSREEFSKYFVGSLKKNYQIWRKLNEKN